VASRAESEVEIGGGGGGQAGLAQHEGARVTGWGSQGGGQGGG
jgi:hypothetical protein